jgi:hypothetical protein
LQIPPASGHGLNGVGFDTQTEQSRRIGATTPPYPWPLRLWDSRVQIVFVHIPKTAGTAVREALFRARPGAANLCDYGPDHPQTSPLVKALRYGPDGDLRRLKTSLDRADAYTLAGHMKAKPVGRVFGPERLATVLRDPVERVVSNWRLYRRRGLFEGSLLEFARLPEIRNVQFRYTRPYQPWQWLFMARQDCLEADMAELSLRLGTEIRVERLNAAPEGPMEIAPFERRQIEALNGEDLELFESRRGLSHAAGSDQEPRAAAAPGA